MWLWSHCHQEETRASRQGQGYGVTVPGRGPKCPTRDEATRTPSVRGGSLVTALRCHEWPRASARSEAGEWKGEGSGFGAERWFWGRPVLLPLCHQCRGATASPSLVMGYPHLAACLWGESYPPPPQPQCGFGLKRRGIGKGETEEGGSRSGL